MSFCQSSRFIYIGLFILAILVLGWGLGQRADFNEEEGLDGNNTNTEGRCSGGGAVGPPRINVTNYHTSWCGHSKRLYPTWEKLMQEFKGHPTIDVTELRCDGGPAQQSVCQQIGIQGFPTVLLSRPDGNIFEYRGDRSLDDLKQWILTTAHAPAPPQASDSA